MAQIKLPNLVKKQPVALICALLCVGLGVGIYIRKDTLADRQATLDDKAAQGKHLKENIDTANSLNKADRLDEQCESMTQAVQAVEARLVHSDQLAINLQYFYKLESETQTKLTDLRQTGVVTLGKNAGKTNYTGIDYVVSIQGTYLQLLDFVRKVENGEHFSRVTGFALSGGAGDNTPNGQRNLSLSLSIELLGLP